jgi:hypothetical protein
VPKSQDYSAARTSYLWYVNLERSGALLLESIYRILTRLKIRKQLETARCQLLLEKAKRLDIQSGEASLSELELVNLGKYEKGMKMLHASERRMDELAMLFRDF